FVKCQTIVVAIIRHFHPFGSHFFCFLCVLFSHLFFAHHICQIALSSNTPDRFDRKVGIVCEVTCKVIGTKLVGRIQSVLCQIVCPCSQCFPMFLCIFCMTFHFCNSSSQHYHIT